MTAPSRTQAAPPTSVPQQVQQHDVAALALEVAAAVAATEVFRKSLHAVVNATMVRWVKVFGSLHGQQSGMRFLGFMEQLAADLVGLRLDPKPVLLDYADKARKLGVEQGFREAGQTPVRLSAVRDFGLAVDAAQAATRAQERIATASRIATTTQEGSFTAVTRAVAPAQQAANEVDRAARTMTNTALNAGIADVAEHVGGKLLWIAERTACVACAALSGHVVNVGDEFDTKATFGEKPIAWIPDGGLTGPPRHPACRCRCMPWLGSNGPTEADLPQALKREAERGVLNGYALPSESERVRTQAADRLLERIGMSKGSRSPAGWQVPQSVKERAERALRKGTFTTGPVPAGRK